MKKQLLLTLIFSFSGSMLGMQLDDVPRVERRPVSPLLEGDAKRICDKQPIRTQSQVGEVITQMRANKCSFWGSLPRDLDGMITDFTVNKKTALVDAVSDGCDISVIKQLIYEGADVNGKDYKGRTAIFLAVLNNQEQLVDLFLSYKANPNIFADLGFQSPLMIAAGKGCISLVQKLLNSGADPLLMYGNVVQRNSAENYGTAKGMAGYAEENRIELQTLLQQAEDAKHAFNDEFIQAAADGDIEKVRDYLTKGANVEARNDRGTNALDCAANTHIVELLLNAGADPNERLPGEFTSLDYAIQNQKADVVRYLLAHGAKIIEQSDIAESDLRTTTLEISQQTGNQEIIQLIQDALHNEMQQ